MCLQKLNYLGRSHRPQPGKCVCQHRLVAVTLLIFVFFLIQTAMYAQNRSEDYLSVKTWILPADALPASELALQNEIYMYQGAAFSGIAFEHYPNGQLLRVVNYQQGKQNGLMLLWYPDGSPQMSASYRDGSLHGRFLGWYQNGSVIYDMVINKGAYAGDNLSEADSSREAGTQEDSEREGPDNDQSPE